MLVAFCTHPKQNNLVQIQIPTSNRASVETKWCQTLYNWQQPSFTFHILAIWDKHIWLCCMRAHCGFAAATPAQKTKNFHLLRQPLAERSKSSLQQLWEQETFILRTTQVSPSDCDCSQALDYLPDNLSRAVCFPDFCFQDENPEIPQPPLTWDPEGILHKINQAFFTSRVSSFVH